MSEAKSENLDDDSPSVIGARPSPMPTEEDRKEAWRSLYIERMVSRGVDKQDAIANFEACGIGPHGFDLDDDPEQAADDEMSYWEAE